MSANENDHTENEDIIALKEFVKYIVQNLVDFEDDVELNSASGKESTIIEVSVHKKDMGKVIGRQGNTVKAIRSLLNSVSAKLDMKVHLNVLDDRSESAAAKVEKAEEKSEEEVKSEESKGEQEAESKE